MIERFEVGGWYHDGRRTYQVVAVEADRLRVRYHGEDEVRRLTIGVQQRLVEAVDGPPVKASPPVKVSPPVGKARRRRRRREEAERFFSNEEVGLVIADIIRGHGGGSEGFMTREMIVQAMLAHSKGAAYVAEASRRGMRGAPEKIAGNMLDHFSKDITNGTSVYVGVFDRKKVGGKWGYRGG